MRRESIRCTSYTLYLIFLSKVDVKMNTDRYLPISGFIRIVLILIIALIFFGCVDNIGHYIIDRYGVSVNNVYKKSSSKSHL